MKEIKRFFERNIKESDRSLYRTLNNKLLLLRSRIYGRNNKATRSHCINLGNR